MTRFRMIALTIATTALPLAAQDRQPALREKLAAKLAAKLEEDWVKDAGWITDYEAALAAAKESDTLVLAYFTRSYAP